MLTHRWTSVYDRMPDPQEHPRVLIYTEGADFAGEQFFDVKTDALNENYYEDPADQPEVCAAATHWMPLPVPNALLCGGSLRAAGWRRCGMTRSGLLVLERAGDLMGMVTQ